MIDSVFNTPSIDQHAIDGSPRPSANDGTAEVWRCPHFKHQETRTHRRSIFVFIVIFLVIGILAAVAGIAVTFATTEKLKGKLQHPIAPNNSTVILSNSFEVLTNASMDLSGVITVMDGPAQVFTMLDFVSSIWIGGGSIVLGIVIFLFR